MPWPGGGGQVAGAQGCRVKHAARETAHATRDGATHAARVTAVNTVRGGATYAARMAVHAAREGAMHAARGVLCGTESQVSMKILMRKIWICFHAAL